ncbi:hypothetical protein ABER61_16510 [Brevibacillus formosus]|uniref:DUF4297 domain-containing protein n=1 Tax=Brevibacillus formosus TaxID=54913 RepID=A0A837KP31_9BACL|nr:hypothetical protein [Brevibacillus formosus]KLH99407.1 hypothetical protein AA984_13005 [Brevibacillus formosus]MED1956827.1 hypothetical protein [Brevibacillus formosus]PSJ92944.1 hypothetical protein C7R91_21730 [Brevibacillus formosus]GED57225.1 hypothetical protein BFO01nite_13570 [Brevibacillus formosus]
MLEQKNNDTKTKLGDIYHYYIVLQHCLELQENEVIFVEKYGDISVVSDDNSKNVEIKHHGGQHHLNNRNTDFWNTLRNWVKYHQNMRQFKKLILFTTSDYSTKSSLMNWNASNGFERLRIIKEIGEDKKSAETSFRPLFDEIFLYDEHIILEVLEKVELHLNQVNITSIEKSLLKSPFFKSIKRHDRPNFIIYLMGYILRLPVSEPHNWSISCEEFESLSCELRDRFTSTSLPMQLPPNTPEFPTNMQDYHDKRFVREINEIQYNSKVTSAISNYYRAQQTIYYTSINNPIFTLDLGVFKQELSETLMENKSSLLDKCDTTDPDDIISKSKKHYDKAMELPATNFGTINPNRGYFQKGIIHKIVEERGHSWNVTK